MYDHMPEGMRHVVDDIVEVLRPEPWPDRFAALYVLLCDKLEEGTGSDPLHLLQEWSGIVTATLEQLPRDSSVVECLALMSVSFNDQWRAQAIARMDRDPNVFDQLCLIYPDWGAIVDRLAEGASETAAQRDVVIDVVLRFPHRHVPRSEGRRNDRKRRDQQPF